LGRRDDLGRHFLEELKRHGAGFGEMLEAKAQLLAPTP
jgi:hypothetical protein